MFNLFRKSITSDITIKASFHKAVCQFSYEVEDAKYRSFEWQVHSFLYYMSRYLVICDDRQRHVMQELLHDLFQVNDQADIQTLTAKAYDSIRDTFSEPEKVALDAVFWPTPPVLLFDVYKHQKSIELVNTFATYKFKVNVSSNGMTSTNLALGKYDKILLPLSVMHFFNSVYGNAATAAEIIMLKKSALSLLEKSKTEKLNNSFIHNTTLEVIQNNPKREAIPETKTVLPLTKKQDWQLPQQTLLNDIDPKSITKGIIPLRSWIEYAENNSNEDPMTIPVGFDSKHILESINLRTTPSILVGGQTGSGKSTFAETTLLMSLLFKNTPDDLRLILIDPKQVQFSQYDGIPHLLHPVITTPQKSSDIIDRLIEIIKKRHLLLERNQVQNITILNDILENRLSHILLVIDEVADLMALDKKEFETKLSYIAKNGIDTGVHVYIGTSRPDDQILPATLRSNFDTTIAFKTASAQDSERLLGLSGAEKLQGKGDMYLKTSNRSVPIRLQAPYVTDEEALRILDFWKKQSR